MENRWDEVSVARLLEGKFDSATKCVLFCSYLQYSSIAARALRRVVKSELQTEIAKREGMAIKYAKWDNGKSGASSPLPTVETRAKAEHH